MNEFIEQFILESRELVEQATAGLLVLEQSPRDGERLDAVFRAFHTLKGGAAIVDFDAMERAMHAAEDVLAAARSGARTMTKGVIGDCLTCLDQVVQWLDRIEKSGGLPAGADIETRAIVARFAKSASEAGEAAKQNDAIVADWARELLARYPNLKARAKTAIRYAPDSESFFRGEDPIASVEKVPGLLSLDLEPQVPWPPLEAFEPFICNVILTALTASPTADVRAALGHVAPQCDIKMLSEVGDADELSGLTSIARNVLEAQILLLAQKEPHGAVGRLASVGTTAANVLRHLNRAEDAERIVRAADRSLSEGAPRYLKDEIESLLSGAAPAIGVQSLLSFPQDLVTRTLRVDATRIDALVNLTGELTVAKNAIGHVTSLSQDDNNALAGVLKAQYGVLDRLIGELQRSVLGMRVLPLRHVLQRFPRLMREMSSNLGKPAALLIEGNDTEADKAIVEMLFEPLMHILRNAMDHGIESPDTRLARGKPPSATIKLRAVRQNETVLIEVQDDGAGIDLARVRQVATERGVASVEKLTAMGEAELLDLIFAPGFSTATEVTEVSGRGVGMDAVRTAVERVGGKISIESEAGVGTTIRLMLPFSVMMTRVMTVEAGGQMFGIPLDTVIETVRVPVERIAPVGASRAVVLRNKTLPVVDLAGILGVAHGESEDIEATLVISRLGGQSGAIRVDRLGDRMDVMLKPLDGLLVGLPGIAGTTLLGDGRVLLVLDLGELLQ